MLGAWIFTSSATASLHWACVRATLDHARCLLSAFRTLFRPGARLAAVCSSSGCLRMGRLLADHGRPGLAVLRAWNHMADCEVRECVRRLAQDIAKTGLASAGSRCCRVGAGGLQVCCCHGRSGQACFDQITRFLFGASRGDLVSHPVARCQNSYEQKVKVSKLMWVLCAFHDPCGDVV